MTYDGQPLRYVRFYNPTHGKMKDLAEVYEQKQREAPALTERWDLYWFTLQGKDASQEIEDPAAKSALVDFRRTYELQAIQANGMRTSGPIVQEMALKLQQLLTGREKVVAVAHSQGNLFVNDVYDALDAASRANVRTVHVAVAADTRRGEYITLAIDQVIRALRAVSNALRSTPPEMPIAALLDDPSGHGFSEIYMNRKYPAYETLKALIDSALVSVKNETTSLEGLFAVTLTSRRNADISVMEPSNRVIGSPGAQVSTANGFSKVGYAGVAQVLSATVDRYTACEVVEGIYPVSVRAGDTYNGADEIKVTLTALDLVHSAEHSFPPFAYGPAQVTFLAFDVQVKRDASGTPRVTVLPTGSFTFGQ